MNSSPLASHKVMTFVNVSDPEHARKFYRDTLKLDFVREELPFAIVFRLSGIMLRVGILPGLVPEKHTVVGWEVPDIATTIKALNEAGVRMEQFGGHMQQDDLGIWTAPGGAQVAWFKDPDGNILSVTQLPEDYPK